MDAESAEGLSILSVGTRGPLHPRWFQGFLNDLGLRKNLRRLCGGVGQLWVMMLLLLLLLLHVSLLRSERAGEGLVFGSRLGDGHSEVTPCSCLACM